MEKIMLFQVSKEDADLIAKLASNMKIRTELITPEQFHHTLGELAENRVLLSADCEQQRAIAGEQDGIKITGSLLVFAGVTDKHIDRMLFELRTRKISVTYKAVLTESNRQWSVRRMLAEMERERMAYLTEKNKI